MKTDVLDSHKSSDLISKFINTPKSQIIHSIKELTIRAPLVLKIISPDAIHKTEIGGVVIVRNKEEIENSFNELISIAKNNKRIRHKSIYLKRQRRKSRRCQNSIRKIN